MLIIIDIPNMPKIKVLSQSIEDTFSRVLDTVLPPRCIATGLTVDQQGMIAPEYWGSLNFIDAPFCAQCGLPFEFSVGKNALCGKCLNTPPHFDIARSAIAYDDNSKKLILGFKYGDRLHARDSFVPWMIRAGQDFLPKTNIIIPVPLHYKRLWKRRFNQAGILAQTLANQTGHECQNDLLARILHTSPHKDMNTKKRADNVKGAFILRSKYKNLVKGKSITIIDDVYTSGSTVNECAKVLKLSGAKSVYVLTLGRVK